MFAASRQRRTTKPRQALNTHEPSAREHTRKPARARTMTAISRRASLLGGATSAVSPSACGAVREPPLPSCVGKQKGHTTPRVGPHAVGPQPEPAGRMGKTRSGAPKPRRPSSETADVNAHGCTSHASHCPRWAFRGNGAHCKEASRPEARHRRTTPERKRPDTKRCLKSNRQ